MNGYVQDMLYLRIDFSQTWKTISVHDNVNAPIKNTYTFLRLISKKAISHSQSNNNRVGKYMMKYVLEFAGCTFCESEDPKIYHKLIRQGVFHSVTWSKLILIY